MILFSAIDYEECVGAYHWHRGFAGADDALFPRQHESFQDLVMQGSVWAARSANGDYLALAYAALDLSNKECEIGGLMVAAQARGKGLGSIMMRLALAHSLLEENVLEDPNMRVVAHVLKSNNAPRGIIENGLRFRAAKPVEIPSRMLPGLRHDPDGFIRGDEYELVKPDSLTALAEWARSWDGSLSGDVADIELRDGVTMELWRDALAELAARHGAEPQTATGAG